ncbi:uncharacterized protein LOC113297913 isoform X1 [Papaver somniferum]|uniref:uncharacterized protein LOC113297913 isoform X1 n=1 Tax=Papaver somniferum TaxID=3469 RepID=UPI000E6FED06|nr:uncharacterized protein LOC113297913 isoform X1 [Papaver somniferum]
MGLDRSILMDTYTGKWVYELVYQIGYLSDWMFSASFVYLSAKRGVINTAWSLYGKMLLKGTEDWNQVMHKWLKQHVDDQAQELFDENPVSVMRNLKGDVWFSICVCYTCFVFDRGKRVEGSILMDRYCIEFFHELVFNYGHHFHLLSSNTVAYELFDQVLGLWGDEFFLLQLEYELLYEISFRHLWSISVGLDLLGNEAYLQATKLSTQMIGILNSAGTYYHLLLAHVTYESLIARRKVDGDSEFYDIMAKIQLMFLYTPLMFVLVVFLRWNLFSTCLWSTKGIMVLIHLKKFACVLVNFSAPFIYLSKILEHYNCNCMYTLHCGWYSCGNQQISLYKCNSIRYFLLGYIFMC